MTSRVDWRLRLVAWLSDRLDAPVEDVGPERARLQMRRTEPALVFGAKRAVDSVRDELLGGVAVRRYVPAGANDGVVVYFHGGGWVIGDLDSHDHVCRALALETNLEVVAVDYRRAPEHRFPAAHDDSLAVTRTLAQTHRAVAVAGDSAGGNLAAAVAQQFALEHRPLRAQLLVYPVLDCAAETASWDRWAAGPILTRERMRYFIREYVPDATMRESAKASPLRAQSVEGVAPARIVLAECDVLHDEGRAYAELLVSGGVATEVDEVAGFTHGFFNLLGLPESRACLSRAAKWLAARMG